MPICANRIEIRRAAFEGFESNKMLGNGSRPIKTFVACDFLEQLRLANEQIAGEPAPIKCLDHQLEQSWIGGQQFEKQAAQSVSFDETDELIQDGVGVRCLCHLVEKCGPQFSKNLFRARCHVRR